ncbi:MAG: hypothetical protein H0V20_08990 [Actinobacteria bacterium]|nr:hypothetical protein [Actinomycetota bacterium]
MPWHLRKQQGLNPTTAEQREREVRTVVDQHGGSLEGFWLSENDKDSYALIEADDNQIRAITRELGADALKKVKARQ